MHPTENIKLIKVAGGVPSVSVTFIANVNSIFPFVCAELCEPVQPGALSQRWLLFSDSSNLLDLPLYDGMDRTLL